MQSIAQSDNVAVGRIVQTALKNGAGIDTMIDRIVKAQEGLFSPHNYSVCARLLLYNLSSLLNSFISKRISILLH